MTTLPRLLLPEKAVIGAADVGSNGIRSEIRWADSSQPTRRERFSVRLGHKVFVSGRLSRKACDRALVTMANIRDAFRAANVTHQRWVATSALREAVDGAEFVAEVKDRLDIDLEVISGNEESRLVMSGVLAKYSEVPPRAIFDLGGGSLEVNLVDGDGAIQRRVSMPLGTVRFLETFDLWGKIHPRKRRMLECHLRPWLDLVLGDSFDFSREACVVCGGNAEAIADIVDKNKTHPKIPVPKLRELLDELLPMRVSQRMERFEIKRNRAEVIGIAGLFLDVLAKKFGITRYLVPGLGLRDGIIEDFLSGRNVPQI